MEFVQLLYKSNITLEVVLLYWILIRLHHTSDDIYYNSTPSWESFLWLSSYCLSISGGRLYLRFQYVHKNEVILCCSFALVSLQWLDLLVIDFCVFNQALGEWLSAPVQWQTEGLLMHVLFSTEGSPHGLKCLSSCTICNFFSTCIALLRNIRNI